MGVRLALLLFLASTAAAREPPAASPPPDPAGNPASRATLPPRPLARRMIDDFGRCLVITRPALAEAVTVAPPVGGDRARPWPFDGRDGTDCLPPAANRAALQMDKPALRGAVFRALYQRRHGSAQPAFAAATPDWAADLANAADPLSREARSHVALRALSACVIAREPAAVHRLLLAGAATGAETAAFAAVMPQISGCLPSGYQLALSKSVVVASLAEVAVRTASPPAP